MSKKVLLFLSNGFEEYEAAVFTDVMGWSRSDGEEGVELRTCGCHQLIKGTWNLNVIPEMQLSDVTVDDFDALALPGGFEEAGYYEDVYSEEFQDLIREFHSREKWIASICVGALPLGKSGILAGKKGTTYSLLESVRPQQLRNFGVDVTENQMEVTDRIITSCGPSSGLEVAFTLLEKLTSRSNAETVKFAMGF
jgi:4-methyl-5(b-hydroxyethyl)-thiazole monophosphate biosynthesis